MRSKTLYATAICLGLCASSAFYLYRFYNPAVSGLTDAQARQFGFSSAQNMVELTNQTEWNSNPNKKLALMKQTFATGNAKQKAVAYTSLIGVKDKETFRQAMALVKTQPEFWDESKPSQRTTTIRLLTQFMEAGNGNKDVMQELTKDENPHVRSIAADSIAYQEALAKSDTKPLAK